MTFTAQQVREQADHWDYKGNNEHERQTADMLSAFAARLEQDEQPFINAEIAEVRYMAELLTHTRDSEGALNGALDRCAQFLVMYADILAQRATRAQPMTP